MNHIIPNSYCTGCGACSMICPKKAIILSRNDEGFVYPRVDENICVECGMCIRHCRIGSFKYRNSFITAKYGRSTDNNILRSGSSGGAFLSIIKCIGLSDENVFGAAYDSDEKCVRIASASETSLNQLCRSKYVDSFTKDSYARVKEQLSLGKRTLYSGCPCQIDGLLHYLGSNTNDNLITVDFICHGVPSQKYFKDRIEFLEKKYASEIIDINFRPKTLGWTCMSIIYSFANGKNKEFAAYADPFFKGFLEDLFLKESCYSCEYREKHSSDITIADFWSYIYLENRIKNDEKGLSLLIANTQKGLKIIEDMSSNDMILHDVDNSFVTKYILRKKEWSPELFERRKKLRELISCRGFIDASNQFYMKSKNIVQLKFNIKKYVVRRRIW